MTGRNTIPFKDSTVSCAMKHKNHKITNKFILDMEYSAIKWRKLWFNGSPTHHV